MRRTLEVSIAVAVVVEHDDETGAYRLVGIVSDDAGLVSDCRAYVIDSDEVDRLDEVGGWLSDKDVRRMPNGEALLTAADAAVDRAVESFNDQHDATRWVQP